MIITDHQLGSDEYRSVQLLKEGLPVFENTIPKFLWLQFHR